MARDHVDRIRLVLAHQDAIELVDAAEALKRSLEDVPGASSAARAFADDAYNAACRLRHDLAEELEPAWLLSRRDWFVPDPRDEA